ncbi:MAG: 5-Nucleotidase domain protein [Verrucomicrobiales bacterium]|nr:5-Nucleotidase domain protein [Verrucomicrobiales bacterium]
MANQGMLAFYPLDKNGNDSSGNGFNAVVSSQVEFLDGMTGAGASFVKSGAYMTLPMSLPRYANNYTVMGWVKKVGYQNIDPNPSDFGTVVGRISARHSDGALAFWFYFDSATQADNQAFQIVTSVKLPLAQWVYFMVTYDQGTKKLLFYLNQQLVETHDLTGRVQDTDRPHFPYFPTMGGFSGQAYAQASTLNGYLDEVALMNVTSVPAGAVIS